MKDEYYAAEVTIRAFAKNAKYQTKLINFLYLPVSVIVALVLFCKKIKYRILNNCL